MRLLLLPASILLLVSSCAPRYLSEQTSTPAIPGPAPTVTRSESLAIAQAYAQTRWIAEDRHRFHGTDARNIEVRTPDAKQGGGFWKTTWINFGVPYKWGGFDTPQSFAHALKEGKYAGDVSNSYKRKLLDAAVSADAAGIDCSGLVSRAWRLPRPYSTRELAGLCVKLESWDELRPGDALNRFNGHVILFSAWKKERTHFYGFEAGPYSGWRVTESVLRVDYLKKRGYVPLRYRNMRDDPPEAADPGEKPP